MSLCKVTAVVSIICTGSSNSNINCPVLTSRVKFNSLGPVVSAVIDNGTSVVEVSVKFTGIIGMPPKSVNASDVKRI